MNGSGHRPFDFENASSDEMSAGAEADFKRFLTLEGTVDGFIHRVEHDPLDNLPAISDIKTVRVTDLEPGVDYQIRNRLYLVSAHARHPSVPGPTFRASFSELERKGRKQMLTTSHCASCHITAQGRLRFTGQHVAGKVRNPGRNRPLQIRPPSGLILLRQTVNQVDADIVKTGLLRPSNRGGGFIRRVNPA